MKTLRFLSHRTTFQGRRSKRPHKWWREVTAAVTGATAAWEWRRPRKWGGQCGPSPSMERRALPPTPLSPACQLPCAQRPAPRLKALPPPGPSDPAGPHPLCLLLSLCKSRQVAVNTQCATVSGEIPHAHHPDICGSDCPRSRLARGPGDAASAAVMCSQGPSKAWKLIVL